MVFVTQMKWLTGNDFTSFIDLPQFYRLPAEFKSVGNSRDAEAAQNGSFRTILFSYYDFAHPDAHS